MCVREGYIRCKVFKRGIKKYMKKKIIDKFEDNLLSESIENEDGLLVCEIDLFRKHAKKALASQKRTLETKWRKESIG